MTIIESSIFVELIDLWELMELFHFPLGGLIVKFEWLAGAIEVVLEECVQLFC
jgi:hypothetical protein